MGVIVIDFDTVMGFGHAYRGLSDSLDTMGKGYQFGASELDKQLRAFGVTTHTGNPHWGGMDLTAAAADASARMGRVSNYLNECSSMLYRQASAATVDDSLDWGGIFRDAWNDTFDFPFVKTIGQEAAEKGLARFHRLAGASFGLVLGIPDLIGGAQDFLAFDGGFWEQTADGLRYLSGVAAVAAGLVAVGIVTVASSPVTALLGGIALGLVLTSELIDLAEEYDAFGSLVSGATDALDFAVETLTDGAHDILATAFPTASAIWEAGGRVVGGIDVLDVLDGIDILLTASDLIDSVQPIYYSLMIPLTNVGMALNSVGSTGFNYFRGAKGGFTAARNAALSQPVSKASIGLSAAMSGLEYGINAYRYGLGSSEAAASSMDGVLSVAASTVPFGGLAYAGGQQVGQILIDHTSIDEGMLDRHIATDISSDMDVLFAANDEAIAAGDFTESNRIMGLLREKQELMNQEASGYKGLLNSAATLLPFHF